MSKAAQTPPEGFQPIEVTTPTAPPGWVPIVISTLPTPVAPVTEPEKPTTGSKES